MRTIHSKLPLPLTVTALVVIVFDQLTKQFFLNKPDFYRTGGFFELYLTTNRGIAFGIPLSGTWLYAVLFAVVVLSLYYSRTYLYFTHSITYIVIGLVIGGGIGNLIDRVRFGYVLDFVKIGPWPLFNVADSAITVAIALLLIYREKIVKNHP